MTCARVVVCLVVLALGGGVLFTQQPTGPDKADKSPDKKAAAASADKKPATHIVEKQPFKIERTVKGILAACSTSFKNRRFVKSYAFALPSDVGWPA